MPDPNTNQSNSPVEIVNKLLVELNESIRGGGATKKELEGIYKSLGLTRKALEEYADATEETAKSATLLQKVTYGTSGAISAVAGGVGSILRVAGAASTAMIALTQWAADAGKEMAVFAAQTGKGSVALGTLRDAYKNITDAGGSVVVSLKEISAAMAAFGSQGFAQLQLSADKSMQQLVANLQNTLSKGIGKEAGTQLTQNLLKAFGNNIDALKEFQSSFLSAGNDIEKQMDALRHAQFIDDSTFTNAIGAILQFKEVSAGAADPAIAATLKWQEVLNRVGVFLDNIQQAFALAFGQDIADLIDGLNKKIGGISPTIETIANKFREWWIVAKTTAENIGEAFISTWHLVAAGLNVFIGPAIVGIRSLAVAITDGPLAAAKSFAQDWKDVGAEISKQFNAGVSGFDFKSIDVELAKERDRLIASQKSSNEKISQQHSGITNQLSDSVKALSNIRGELSKLIAATEIWSKGLEQTGKSLSTISRLSYILGDSFSAAGRKIQDLGRESFEDAIRSAKTLIDTSARGLPLAEKQIELLRKQISSGDTSKETEQQLNEAIGQRNHFLENQLHAYEEIQAAGKQALAPLERSLELTTAQKEVSEAQLEISKALYGTPALSVAAIANVVEQMQREKDLLQDMSDQNAAMIRSLESLGRPAEELIEYKKRQLQLDKDIARKTAEQLGMLRELRDGYLSAVQAQAIGAGKFEKIVLTQEKNLAIALDKRIAKQNYLLGQTGKAARAGNRLPVQYSAEGMGILQNQSGQPMSKEDMDEYTRKAIENVGDASTRELMRANMSLISQIHGQSRSAMKQISDHANDSIRRSAGLLGMRGNVNYDIVEGNAVNKSKALNKKQTAPVEPSIDQKSIQKQLKDSSRMAFEAVQKTKASYLPTTEATQAVIQVTQARIDVAKALYDDTDIFERIQIPEKNETAPIINVEVPKTAIPTVNTPVFNQNLPERSNNIELSRNLTENVAPEKSASDMSNMFMSIAKEAMNVFKTSFTPKKQEEIGFGSEPYDVDLDLNKATKKEIEKFDRARKVILHDQVILTDMLHKTSATDKRTRDDLLRRQRVLGLILKLNKDETQYLQFEKRTGELTLPERKKATRFMRDEHELLAKMSHQNAELIRYMESHRIVGEELVHAKERQLKLDKAISHQSAQQYISSRLNIPIGRKIPEPEPVSIKVNKDIMQTKQTVQTPSIPKNVSEPMVEALSLSTKQIATNVDKSKKEQITLFEKQNQRILNHYNQSRKESMSLSEDLSFLSDLKSGKMTEAKVSPGEQRQKFYDRFYGKQYTGSHDSKSFWKDFNTVQNQATSKKQVADSNASAQMNKLNMRINREYLKSFFVAERGQNIAPKAQILTDEVLKQMGLYKDVHNTSNATYEHERKNKHKGEEIAGFIQKFEIAKSDFVDWVSKLKTNSHKKTMDSYAKSQPVQTMATPTSLSPTVSQTKSVNTSTSTPTKTSGGGHWTSKVNNIANALQTAQKELRDLGPVLDDLDTQDHGYSSRHPGVSGNFIPG